MELAWKKWLAAALVALAGLATVPAGAQEAPRPWSALAGLAVGSAGSKEAPRPWFAFTSRDEAALAVVDRYFRRGDFLNINAAKRAPQLQERIGRDRLYRLSPNLEDVAEWSRKACRDPDSAGLILYDIEEWEHTSRAEKADPIGAVRRGAEIVRASGCRDYGMAPGRAYLAGHTRTCFSGVGRLPQGVQWRELRVFVIQSQGMLRGDCMRRDPTMEEFKRFVGDMTAMARRGNPDIIVLAEVSFNRSRPDTIVKAIEAVKNTVDGIYLAYPVEGDKCDYCTPRDLDFVLSRFRAPLPR